MDQLTTLTNSQGHAPLPVTLFLFAFNQEKFIAEACHSALAQDYSPLEIIFSDDCSTDKTFAIMEQIASEYKGPHTVRLNKNASNMGLIPHVNKCFEMSSGELIVGAAGDDISLPERVRQSVEAFLKSGKKAQVIHSSVTRIDEHGKVLGPWIPPVVAEPLGMKEASASMSLYIGASAAWNKKLYEKYGPIQYEKTYEDLVLGYRALLEDGLVYISEPLVSYRVGFGITSGQKLSLKFLAQFRTNQQKNLQLARFVFSQRLLDLQRSDRVNKRELAHHLERQIALVIKRSLIYSPLEFLRSLFSRDFFLCLQALILESYQFLRFLAGWWRIRLRHGKKAFVS